MFPSTLLFISLLCLSFLDLLMRLIPTIYQCFLIEIWKSSGLISVDDYDDKQHLLRKELLLTAGNCF